MTRIHILPDIRTTEDNDVWDESLQQSDENSLRKHIPTHLIRIEIYSVLIFAPAIICSIPSKACTVELIIYIKTMATTPIVRITEYSELYLLRNMAITDETTDIAHTTIIFKIQTPALLYQTGH